jgi:hypothetical protein
MRDPSLHVKRSDLIAICWNMGIPITEHIDQIMLAASKISIRNRVFVTTKTKGKKKSDRVVESDTQLLEQFNRIYMGCLVSHSIKALSIGKQSPQWITLKEVCFNAKEFSDMFSIGYEEGFKSYIETGIHLLGNKFGIYRLKGWSNKIVEYHKDKLLIENDKDPDGTDQVILAWSTAVRVYFKTTIELENDAQRAHFIHAREDADSMKADYYDWIYSAFEKYSYLSSIPSFSQFYGDQAKINYQLYKAKVKKENNTNEEQEYFKQIKNEKTIKTKADVQKESIRKTRLHGSLEEAGSGDAG